MMNIYEKIVDIGEAFGFKVGKLNVKTIEVRQEIRMMCEKNICGMYALNWSCPPGCGSLKECQKKISKYTQGILVQTIGDTEDEFDVEGMLEIERRHKEAFLKFYEELKTYFSDVLALGSGCCTRCLKCSYTDTACRFPDQQISSMEAYGILVLQVCRDNQMDYYYGPKKIAYTGCFLF